MDSKIEANRTIAAPVSGPLSRSLTIFKNHQKTIAAAAILIIGGALAYVWWTRRGSADDYVTDKVSRGTVEVVVSATGTVQAVTTVQVGSQVSGTVSWLGADFKSHVSQGQVVAKLDPALFQAQVNTAQANLLNSQAGVQAAMTDIQNQTANVEAAKANDRANAAQRDDAIAVAKQNEKLKGIIPDREIEAAQNAAKAAIARYSQASSQINQAQAQLEIARAKLKQAQAGVEQSKAQLQQAKVNLDHTIIASPIDGVVVSRSVDVGQTVAASLSAPTLFTIANDLTNMQVLASIDEADVGQVREHGNARFGVDAFPGQVFSGDITQVRLNAQTVQNVVTYQAVISVANPDQRLMPGMTANITIPVARRDDVLRVPNAALRFKPDLNEQQQKDLQAKIDAFRQQQQALRAGENAQQGDQNQSQGDQKSAQADNSSDNKGGKNKGDHKTGGEQRSGERHFQGRGQSGDKQAQADKSTSPSEASTADNTDAQANDTGKRSGGRGQGHGTRKPDSSGDTGASASSGGEGKKHRSEGSGQGKGTGDRTAGNRGGNGQRHPENAKSGDKSKQQNQQGQNGAQQAAADQGASSGSRGGGRGAGGGQRQYQVIWLMTANKKLEPHVVRTGITDGRLTEIVAADLDLKDGDVIVIGGGEASANNNRPQQTGAPFGQQRPPGAGGAGGGRGR